MRRFYCEEELRLNRRTAPQLYLDVQPVTGTAQHPVMGGAGPAIEWALHMRAFAQDGLWDRLARAARWARRRSTPWSQRGDLHRDAAVAGPRRRYGLPAQVRAPMQRQPAGAGVAVPRRG